MSCPRTRRRPLAPAATIINAACSCLAMAAQVVQEAPGGGDGAGHSYGSAVITEAGNHPALKALVYIAAFAPDKGESVNTLIADPPPGRLAGPLGSGCPEGCGQRDRCQRSTRSAYRSWCRESDGLEHARRVAGRKASVVGVGLAGLPEPELATGQRVRPGHT